MTLSQSTARIDQFVDTYKSELQTYHRLIQLVRRFLVSRVKERFKDAHRPVLQSEGGRTKDPASLRKKLEHKHELPVKLNEINDLAGVRLVFYFRDHLDAFCDEALLQVMFGQESEPLVKYSDRNQPQDRIPRFWYDAYQATLKVGNGSLFYHELTEDDQRQMMGRRCEVQLCTVFEHVWAETSHDLLYKLEKNNLINAEVSEEVQERWSRLSALLRTADKELVEGAEIISRAVEPLREAVSADVYPKVKYKGKSYRWEATSFWYELLDNQDANGLTFERYDPFFCLDLRMMEQLGISNFKKIMWDQLASVLPSLLDKPRYDSTVVRAIEWQAEARMLTVQPALWSDAELTDNRLALDVPLSVKSNQTLRDLVIGNGGSLPSFKTSPLCNAIGISAIVWTGDEKLTIGLRSSDQVFDPDEWGCSVGGALEWPDLGCQSSFELKEVLKKAILRECNEELGFSPKQEELDYLAFTRELACVGKPSFFMLIRTILPSKDVEKRWQLYAVDNSEFARLLFVTLEDAKCIATRTIPSCREALGNHHVSEDLRMGLALAYQRLRVLRTHQT